MVMSGMYFNDGDVPFQDVIIHPTVFNAEGKRMSKSLGTGVDPLDLMDHYGADGMRFGLMLQVTGTQDLKFAEEKLLSSRNFANKIWNASRFVMLNLDGYEPGAPVAHTVADRWILSRLADLALRVDEGLDTYEFGETARALYDFFWSEYCDWYIELSKGRLAAGGELRIGVQRILVFVLDQALRLLHPIMPFVTEAIWNNLPLPESDCAASLMIASWPDSAALSRFTDEGAESSIELVQEVVVAIRAIRARYGVSPREALGVVVKAPQSECVLLEGEASLGSALAGLGSLAVHSAAEKPAHSAVAVAGNLEVYVPLEGLVDFEAEAARLTNERDKYATELERLERKLSNEGFLAKAAPEIIEKDRSRATELSEALVMIDSQLAELA
jgi:valyl-tRNA synthetase